MVCNERCLKKFSHPFPLDGGEGASLAIIKKGGTGFNADQLSVTFVCGSGILPRSDAKNRGWKPLPQLFASLTDWH
jgi:hypothetical protein